MCLYMNAILHARAGTDAIGAMTGAIAGAHLGNRNLVGTWWKKLKKGIT